MRRGVQRRVRGQAMVEYLVVGLAVAAMFFLPWDGNPGSDTVVELMLDAIRTAFAKFLSAVSLPV
ncbi:hypothetical protein NYO99_19075 [Pelomonas sp. UHG3]|jgi:hypothetical protein|uniref:Uncharacterized protein n=1 Tax=Roseateles hydrophilus TaxID=2975054 RepID=A0ACC6CFM8_9BURK|nr:hypothetical protein [Pelomonas sp. UHG3]MCY4747084.1 hypothetical protein [Pelomonas sp. UHG3]